MPRDLFGDVTRPSISVGNRKWYTLPVSLLSHSAIVVVLVALPILAPAVMPSVFADDDPTWIATVLPPPPPPPAPRMLDAVKPIANPNAAPVTAPDKIAPETHLDLEWQNRPAPGVVDGSGDLDRALAPPPPPPPPPPQPTPVRVGHTVRAPLKLRNVDPVYSKFAIEARIQGIVIIEATIGADGRVVNARILRSVPMLDQSALEAVRQWEYAPSMLNGVPVPVIMTVTVQFTLSR